eukprot:3346336-Amphidinium_carterae.1
MGQDHHGHTGVGEVRTFAARLDGRPMQRVLPRGMGPVEQAEVAAASCNNMTVRGSAMSPHRPWLG